MMPPGPPGHNLGVAHCLKHYLNPVEHWDDLVVVLLPDKETVRPPNVASTLAKLGIDSPHTTDSSQPGEAVTSQCSFLTRITHDGYRAVVLGCFADSDTNLPEGLSAEYTETRPVFRCKGGRAALDLPGGIVAIGCLKYEKHAPEHPPALNTLELRTAYRITMNINDTFGRVPQFPAARALRIEVAELLAEDQVALLAAGGTP
jgi:hypothetical protein